jgi:hypothetical protein
MPHYGSTYLRLTCSLFVHMIRQSPDWEARFLTSCIWLPENRLASLWRAARRVSPRASSSGKSTEIRERLPRCVRLFSQFRVRTLLRRMMGVPASSAAPRLHVTKSSASNGAGQGDQPRWTWGPSLGIRVGRRATPCGRRLSINPSRRSRAPLQHDPRWAWGPIGQVRCGVQGRVHAGAPPPARDLPNPAGHGVDRSISADRAGCLAAVRQTLYARFFALATLRPR